MYRKNRKMRNTMRIAVRIAFGLLGLVVVSTIAACSNRIDHRWKEEIKLHDGSYIWLDRHVQTHASGFPSAREGSPIIEEFEYPPLGVRWSFKWIFDKPVEQVAAFDVFDGTAYLVVTTGNRDQVCTPGTPPGTFTANYYVWKNGRMSTTSRERVPMEEMIHNMDTRYSGNPAVLTWTMKTRRNARYFGTTESVIHYFMRPNLQFRCQ